MAPTNLFVFGDSLSDTGNLFAATGRLFPPSPPYFNGRFSNGPVAVEQLATLPGSSYSFQQSNNFAFGGATTGRANVLEDDLRTNLPGLLDEIDLFRSRVGTGSADPNGLYVVWAGSNDFTDTIGGSPLPDPSGAGTTFADPAVLLEEGTLNIRSAISTLESSGAKNFVVPNVPNLGRLPAAGGASEELTAISKAFNAAVDLELSNLKSKVTRVDLYSLGESIAADPGKFGFTNVTTPFLLAPLGSDPNQFFFWDQFHPTTKTHGIFADTINQTINGTIPQPSFNIIRGNNRNNNLVGTAANDDIFGFAGNDVLNGLQGNDRLRGDEGNDQLSGSQGDDILSGGDGTDLLIGNQGSDIGFGGAGVDRLLGQVGKDILVGDAGKDTVSGGIGDDYLLGGDGQDDLQGDNGRDILNGGAGRDRLNGGAGDDRINGGAGDDQITGGQGADQFIYRPGGGNDVITDFEKGSDKIDLSSFRFQGFSDFTAKATLSGSTITLGTGSSLQLNGVTVSTLTASDFILAQV